MSSNDFMNDERFDGLYMNVAQTTRGIDPLLHTLFSFLRRKTDFFTEKGTDEAVKKVNDVLKEHVALIQKEEAKKAAKKAAPKKKKAAPKKKEPVVQEEEVLEMGKDGGFDVTEAAPKTAPKAAAKTPPTAAKVEEPKDSAAKKAPEPEKKEAATADDNSKNVNDDADDDKRGPPPVGNGGIVDEKYTWTQTLAEVNVVISVPENTRGRDLNVTIAKKHLKVGLRSQPGKWLVDAPLTKPIKCDDSFWTVEDGSRLAINLQKSNDMEWWDSVCQDDPKIDVRSIQPESSKIGDLDGETRKTVEKMMYDQRQKALGLPSSEEEKKMDMFSKFKDQHPEMDFSNAKIT